MDNAQLESLLDKAKEKEKKYEWLQAAEFYKKAIDLVTDDKDFLKAELQERTGFCFSKAAFQVKTTVEYRRRIDKAIENYKEAIFSYDLSEKEEEKKTKNLRVKAKILDLTSCITSDSSKKEELFIEYLKLEQEALDNYMKADDYVGIGRACNDIIEKRNDRELTLSTWEKVKDNIDNIIKYGEMAIIALSKVNNKYELARTYNVLSRLTPSDLSNILSVAQREVRQKKLMYSKKALELSEEVGDAYLMFMSNWRASFMAWFGQNDIVSALEYCKKAEEYAEKTKDNLVIATAKQAISTITYPMTLQEEDPDKQKAGFEKAIEMAQDAIKKLHLFSNYSESLESYRVSVESLTWLASIEINPDNKRSILEEAVRIGFEGLKYNEGCTGINARNPLQALSIALCNLSTLETKITKKRELLNQALGLREKVNRILEEIIPFGYFLQSRSHNYLALIQAELAKIEVIKEKKIHTLRNAVATMEQSLKLMKKIEGYDKGFLGSWTAKYNYWFGGILRELYLLTKDRNLLIRAIEVYKDAGKYFDEEGLTSRSAGIFWRIAMLYDSLGDSLEAATNYRIAGTGYNLAAKKIPQLKDFYTDYSLYMRAWNDIEQAKYYHTREKYSQAMINYENAGKIHQELENWSYLAPNYFAWAKMEQAEEFSRSEKSQQAIDNFQKAIEFFQKTEHEVKTKINENQTAEEKDLIAGILKASDLRCKYCQSRILMEEAKLLERQGNYLDSSRSYGEAVNKILKIVETIDGEAERKELRYIAILCQAWEKMAIAEETASSESYLEAAALFEQAKEQCYTRNASLWALGNSSFCKGLAAGIRYKTGMDLKENSLAKRYIKDAASSYLQAGFKNASEYAKATQRLFDAYVFMNQAESEVDPEKKAKQYQMAENLLQIAAGSFMKAKQPEKTAQVQQILENVREEKALAVSLSQVMQAPSIASTTLSFSAPTPTSEASVGLESFERANVQANLVTQLKEVKVRESFCISVEFINAGREPALLMCVEDVVPSDFVVVNKPEIYRLEDTTLNMKGKQIAPLKLVEVKLTLQPSKKGKYQLNPKVHYLDERGQNKFLQLKTLEINVEEVVLEDRVSTGTQELDSLLLGGIPQEYAVVLTGSPSDERKHLIKNFLEAGNKKDEVVFYVSTEADGLETSLENPNFVLFLCNPKPKTKVPDLPNVYKLRSKTDLTNLSISLAKAYRNIDPSKKKRICVENISDVLVDYETKATRKWISELITDLGAKGFTMLTVMDPTEHPADQATTVINLFDGEINITQSDDPINCKNLIVVKKLRNQEYIKNPICLT